SPGGHGNRGVRCQQSRAQEKEEASCKKRPPESSTTTRIAVSRQTRTPGVRSDCGVALYLRRSRRAVPGSEPGARTSLRLILAASAQGCHLRSRLFHGGAGKG